MCPLCIVWMYMLLFVPVHSHLYQSVLIICTALKDVFFKFIVSFLSIYSVKAPEYKVEITSLTAKECQDMRDTHCIDMLNR